MSKPSELPSDAMHVPISAVKLLIGYHLEPMSPAEISQMRDHVNQDLSVLIECFRCALRGLYARRAGSTFALDRELIDQDVIYTRIFGDDVTLEAELRVFLTLSVITALANEYPTPTDLLRQAQLHLTELHDRLRKSFHEEVESRHPW